MPISKHLSAGKIGRELSQWFAAASSRGLLVCIIDGLDQVRSLIGPTSVAVLLVLCFYVLACAW